MILITGGSGYVGSHAVAELLRLNNQVVVLDNLSNSSEIAIKNLRKISDKSFDFIKADLNDEKTLFEIFSKFKITTVFHFAGLKSISESINNPSKYYYNNVVSTIKLLEVMNKFGVYEFIFSSSATVYDSCNKIPWKETDSIAQFKHPYSENKIVIERFLKNLSKLNKKWKISVLRYFNPLGAHSSGFIGEFKIKNNTNLMPNIIKTILGYQNVLSVYGGNYNTRDGTGVRDFIHIEDLIDGHLKAKKYLENNNGYFVWNLGAGRGFSVLEIVEKSSEIFNQKINYSIVDRRSGDLDEYYADISKSYKELQWKPKKNVECMIYDTYNFITKYKNNLF